MALFDVPGWSVPSDAQPTSTANAKKRKRPSGAGVDKLHAAEINLDKLMKQLDQPVGQDSKRKKKGSRNSSRGDGDSDKRHTHQNDAGGRPKPRKEPYTGSTAPQVDGKRRAKQPVKSPKKRDDTQQGKIHPLNDRRKADSRIEHSDNVQESSSRNKNLTSLQSHMKSTLDGARFRSVFASSRFTTCLQVPPDGSMKRCTSPTATWHLR